MQLLMAVIVAILSATSFSMFVLVSNIVSVCDMSSDIEFGTKG